MVCGLLFVVLAAMSVAAQPSSDPLSPVTIDEQIDRMTSDERIAQLMIVGIPTHTGGAELESVVAGWRVGGVVLYAANLGSVAQVRGLTAAIRRAAGPITPFIAIDQEGGIVRRLQHGVTVVPSNMAIGATGSADLARRSGFAVGAGLRNLGLTMNFAPVLDVLPDAGTAALHTRAFGNQPGIVADLGVAFMQGQRAGGIIPVGKHFPGQGRALEDSHRVLPILDITHQELAARDLVPFHRAIEAGLPAIMTGHVAVPRITGKNDLAATLSSEVVTRILRKDLRFEGVVISDALEMKAFSQPQLIGETAVQAIMAGCDMVLVAGAPQHRREVFNGLRRVYRDGRLTEARLRESLRRILTLKASASMRLPPTRATAMSSVRSLDEL
jgi:beta-N-acetylhexosaminidase